MPVSRWLHREPLFDPIFEIHDLIDLHSNTRGFYGLTANRLYTAGDAARLANRASHVAALCIVRAYMKTDGEGDVTA